jgi:hypothetical protein
MTDDERAQVADLARRAVAAPGWRWLPGMLTSTGLRVLRVDDDGYTVGYKESMGYIWTLGNDALPDLTDAATRGCLLELIRMGIVRQPNSAPADGIEILVVALESVR